MNLDAPYAPVHAVSRTPWWPWAAAFALHVCAAGLVWWLVQVPMPAVGNKGAAASEPANAFDAQRLMWLDAGVQAPVPAQSKAQAVARPATLTKPQPTPTSIPTPPVVDVALAQQPQVQFEPTRSRDATASEAVDANVKSDAAMQTATPVALDENTPTVVKQAATNSLPSVLQAYSPPPDYPALSKRLGEQGTVVLRVHVSVAGQPLAALLQQSSGFERLDRAAQQAVSGWRFVPGQRDGQPQTVWFEVPVRFELN